MGNEEKIKEKEIMWGSRGRIFAKKVTIDGIKFDSEQEGIYYQELKEKEKNGEISNLEIHPNYELLPSFLNNNQKHMNRLSYEPDFVFFDKEQGRKRYIDVKGFETEEFKLKHKLFDYYLLKNDIYGKAYLEVLKYSKTTGFVPIEQYKEVMKTRKQKKEEERKYYKSIVLKQQHDTEIARRKEVRELKRIDELVETSKRRKLTKAEKDRLNELLDRYDMKVNINE